MPSLWLGRYYISAVDSDRQRKHRSRRRGNAAAGVEAVRTTARLHAPAEGGVGAGEVTERLLQPREDLVLPGLREDKGRVGLNVCDQLVLVLGLEGI